MAYPIAAGSILEVSEIGRLNEQRVMNTFHYMCTASYEDGLATLTLFANAFEAADGVHSRYVECLSEDVTDIQIRYQWITPLRYIYLSRNPAKGEGQIADGSLPPNTAMTVTKVGELANRHNIGGWHLPGVPLSAQDGGRLSAPQIALLQAFAEEATSEIVIVAAPFLPVIFNRAEPSESAHAIGFRLQDTIRVERRRTVGLGE